MRKRLKNDAKKGAKFDDFECIFANCRFYENVCFTAEKQWFLQIQRFGKLMKIRLNLMEKSLEKQVLKSCENCGKKEPKMDPETVQKSI